jgi:hypothetical protein
MLEQTIYLKMVELARQYPEPYRRQYMEATDRFGLPYCEFLFVQNDYVCPFGLTFNPGDPFIVRRKVTNQYGYPIYKCGVPIILMTLNVRVRMHKTPNTFTVIENPLYSSNFPSQASQWDEETHFSWKAMFDDVVGLSHFPNARLKTNVRT